MMRTILVPLAEGIETEPALDAGLALAKRLKAHIRALFIRPDPRLAMSYLPEAFAATGLSQAAIERVSESAAAKAQAQFEAWRKNREVAAEPSGRRLDSCFAGWSEETGEVEALVTRFGRVSDVIAMSRFPSSTRVTASRIFDAAVFGSGRPTLIAPPSLPWDPAGHVMIAWNGSLEASRAVFAAMPLLHMAERVSIFAADEPGAEPAPRDDLVESLAWHGIRAERVAAEAASAGPALLAAARRYDATMIVMGAYTHSRLRQSFLGGVTTHVLANAEIPVLLSH